MGTTKIPPHHREVFTPEDDVKVNKFLRVWAMPNADTFQIKPIGEFVSRYLRGVSVDPFARNSTMATYTNDMNPTTSAQHHMDAISFVEMLAGNGVVADVVIFDPPYSPRQISECYAAAEKKAGMIDTQNAKLYADCKNAIRKICKPGSIVLSFGWNSSGMGKEWVTEEIMLVAHGGAHNDTICMAQRMVDN